MEPIPIYDATAPIACTIGTDEIDGRIELLGRMRANMRTIERTSDGLLLHFAHTTDVETDVRRFAADEKRCCEFWGFAVAVDDDELTLRWDGPPTTRQLLDELHSYFTGTRPISDFSGLL